MAQRADTFDLGRLSLSSGEARSVHLTVPVDPLAFGGETYTVGGSEVEARLDVSRTTGAGYALRLRFDLSLSGPCMRCLGDAGAPVGVDLREVHQLADDDEDLASEYLEENELDLRAWVRDALVLALPVQIVCREECRGLCAICGADLNEAPSHEHEREPDPRWAKLSELKLE
ncbi:YceD family protein [soil metagenome]